MKRYRKKASVEAVRHVKGSQEFTEFLNNDEFQHTTHPDGSITFCTKFKFEVYHVPLEHWVVHYGIGFCRVLTDEMFTSTYEEVDSDA